jgi:hypothetical protein
VVALAALFTGAVIYWFWGRLLKKQFRADVPPVSN